MRQLPKSRERSLLEIYVPPVIAIPNVLDAQNRIHKPHAFLADISLNLCEIEPDLSESQLHHRCVPHCEKGFYEDGDKCKQCSTECESCSAAELCDTCHGARLLIDVKHYGHLDHGHCVDKCPTELIADYSNTIQAKCVLKKNNCAAGYFESTQGACLECDKACSICHGPGPLQCDTCAQGFGNWSVGYCRPCCSPDQLKLGETHCEDCTKQQGTGIIGGLSTFYSTKESTNFLAQFFIVIGLVLLGAVFFMFCRQFICCYCCRRGQNGNRTDLDTLH